MREHFSLVNSEVTQKQSDRNAAVTRRDTVLVTETNLDELF